MKKVYTMTNRWRKNRALRLLRSSPEAYQSAVEDYEFYVAGLYHGFPMQPTTASLVRMIASLDSYDAFRRPRPESKHRAKLRRRRHQFDERPHLHINIVDMARDYGQPLVGRVMESAFVDASHAIERFGAVADQLLPQPDWLNDALLNANVYVHPHLRNPK